MNWRTTYVYANFCCSFQRCPLFISRSNVSRATAGLTLPHGLNSSQKIENFAEIYVIFGNNGLDTYTVLHKWATITKIAETRVC